MKIIILFVSILLVPMQLFASVFSVTLEIETPYSESSVYVYANGDLNYYEKDGKNRAVVAESIILEEEFNQLKNIVKSKGFISLNKYYGRRKLNSPVVKYIITVMYGSGKLENAEQKRVECILGKKKCPEIFTLAEKKIRELWRDEVMEIRSKKK